MPITVLLLPAVLLLLVLVLLLWLMSSLLAVKLLLLVLLLLMVVVVLEPPFWCLSDCSIPLLPPEIDPCGMPLPVVRSSSASSSSIGVSAVEPGCGPACTDYILEAWHTVKKVVQAQGIVCRVVITQVITQLSKAIALNHITQKGSNRAAANASHC